MNRRYAIAALAVFSVIAIAALLLGTRTQKAIPAGSAAGIRLPFVANEGEADPRVAFTAYTFGGPLFVTRDGSLVYNLPERSGNGPGWTGSGIALVEKPANPFQPRLKGIGKVAARVNEFVGRDPARWRLGAKAYDTVSIGEPWQGISLSVAARGNNVEKLFTVAPGADPSAIRMSVEGADALSVDTADTPVRPTCR